MCVCVCFISCYFFLSDPTDAILKSVPDSFKVLNLLANISASWEKIGSALRVESNTLAGLKQKGDDNVVKLKHVIEAWKRTQTSPDTWETLINAIEGPIVKDKRKADEIRTYLATLPC